MRTILGILLEGLAMVWALVYGAVIKLWRIYLIPALWADRVADETQTPFCHWCRENGHARGAWTQFYSFAFDPVLIDEWHTFNAKAYGKDRWSNWRYFLANTPARWRLILLRTFAYCWLLLPFVAAVVWPVDYLCRHLILVWTR